MNDTRGSISVRAWLVFIATLIGVLYFAFRPAETRLSSQLSTKKNLSRIGEALLQYEHSHHQLPATLAELVPEFVPVTNAFLFFPPETLNLSNSWSQLRDRLDSEGAFIYLGEKGRPVDALLYERFDPLTGVAKDSVSVVGTNFGVQTHARAELERRLRVVKAGRDI